MAADGILRLSDKNAWTSLLNTTFSENETKKRKSEEMSVESDGESTGALKKKIKIENATVINTEKRNRVNQRNENSDGQYLERLSSSESSDEENSSQFEDTNGYDVEIEEEILLQEFVENNDVIECVLLEIINDVIGEQSYFDQPILENVLDSYDDDREIIQTIINKSMFEAHFLMISEDTEPLAKKKIPM